MGEARRRRETEDRQKLVKLKPIPAEGMTMLIRRCGGTYDLPTLETSPGVFLSAWAIHNAKAMELIQESADQGRGCVLQLVVDTNVSGHPTVSISVRQIDLVGDGS